MLQNIIYKNAWSYILLISSVSCARILGIFPIDGRSHFNFHEEIMKSLLSAGHQVTMIAPFQPHNVHENLTIINSVTKKPLNMVAVPSKLWMFSMILFTDIMEQDCLSLIESEQMKALENFDILFVEMLPIFQCYLPVAKKLQIPVIGTISTRSIVEADMNMGYSRLPSVFPAEWFNRPPKMSFYERFLNFLDYMQIRLVHLSGERRATRIHDEYFHQHEWNSVKVSLLFANTHASIWPRLTPPNSINIGGIHVKSSSLKPLPENLKKFIENANHGVIFFSLGSVATKDVLAPELRTALKNTFAKIPQRVIWKYDDQIEGLSDNVLLSKWVPQKEILAHKNVLAFITHCGLGSVYEAVYFRTPVIMIPIFADQPSNAAALSSLGVGLSIDFGSLNEVNLLDAINKVVNDTKYRENMAELSSKFKDDPMAPGELVEYWTEYVLRHKGAFHLRPVDADMPLYQFLMLDVIFLIFCLAIIGVYVSFICSKYLLIMLYNIHKWQVLALKTLKFGKTPISVEKKMM